VYRRLEDGASDEPVRPAILTFGGLFGPPPGVPGFGRVADITVAEPGPAQVQGNQVSFTDAQGLSFGRRYTYVVVALDEKGRSSPPSNRVVVALTAAPGAPPRLEARPSDTQARLTLGGATLVDGSPAPADLVCDVFRATTPGPPAAPPLNLEPVVGRQYVDLAVQNDVTYHYVPGQLSRIYPRANASWAGWEGSKRALAGAFDEGRNRRRPWVDGMKRLTPSSTWWHTVPH
jgi:hypothetical protein